MDEMLILLDKRAGIDKEDPQPGDPWSCGILAYIAVLVWLLLHHGPRMCYRTASLKAGRLPRGKCEAENPSSMLPTHQRG
jgi:hypothetical protein